MTLKQILEMLVGDGGPIVLTIGLVMTFVQIVPVKINPWDAIFAWIGRQLNKEVLDKIEVVENRLNEHIKDSEEQELKARRTSILDFSSSIMRGANYHREKFEFMMAECDSYEKYCQDNNIKNGVADASMSEIRRIYHEKLIRNDFLFEEASSGGDENEAKV